MVLASLSFVSSPHTFPTKHVHDRQDVPVVAIASYVRVPRHVDQIDNALDLVRIVGYNGCVDTVFESLPNR